MSTAPKVCNAEAPVLGLRCTRTARHRGDHQHAVPGLGVSGWRNDSEDAGDFVLGYAEQASTPGIAERMARAAMHKIPRPIALRFNMWHERTVPPLGRTEAGRAAMMHAYAAGYRAGKRTR